MTDPPWLKAALASGAARVRHTVNQSAFAAAIDPPAALRDLWTEAEFTTQAIHQAHYFGWAVAHFRQSWTKDGRAMTAVQGDGAGYPDLHAVRGAWQLFPELKVKKNTASDEQLAWLDRLARLPNTIVGVFYPKDWDTLSALLESPMPQCVSCKAAIVWARTAKNRNMPIDAEPGGDGVGNVILVGDGTCIVLAGKDLEEAYGKGTRLHRSHFETCPNAGKHRGTRR